MKRIFLITILLSLMLDGCSGITNSETPEGEYQESTEKESRNDEKESEQIKSENLYDTEKTKTEKIGEAKYKVLKRWAKSADVSEDGNRISYLDEKNALIMVQMSDIEYRTFDESDREDLKEGWIDGLKSAYRDYDEISTDLETICGLTAITTLANIESDDGYKYKFYQTAFACNYKIYYFGIMAKNDIKKDYGQEFESLKNSVEVEYNPTDAEVTNAAQDSEDLEPQEAQENLDKNTKGVEHDSNASMGQQNALRSALQYLSHSSFSYERLAGQLEYEGYTNEEAIYAVDNCGADWNEQALKSANSYLSHSAFSYQGLIDQLQYEGFTSEQAAYGADNCGADWNEQAAKSAEQYLSHSSFSRDGLIEQLQFEGFTTEQAVYGVDANGY